MENTALNGTATKDHEDWKKKKGYGPIIVAVSLALLLGLSFYMGGHFDDGTNLPPNVAASSSSMSLVGSSTAASDLKTLTIELDDDENIDALLGWSRAEQRQGGSSAHCKKNTGYNCGAVFPLDGNTCSQKGCCCRQEDGTGDKFNTCDNAKGYAYRGCNSCWGKDACFKTNNINAGTSSCHGRNACFGVEDSTIDNDSCHGAAACSSIEDSTVGNESCQGYDSCYGMKNGIIGKGSCHGKDSCFDIKNVIIGKGSCTGDDYSSDSCRDVSDSTIGNDSCHGEQACFNVDHITVGDESCEGDYSCYHMKNVIIGKGSCNGDGYSCAGDAVTASENVKIGNNSCNGKEVCKKCKHNVPDDACNQGITTDLTASGYCKYCM